MFVRCDRHYSRPRDRWLALGSLTDLGWPAMCCRDQRTPPLTPYIFPRQCSARSPRSPSRIQVNASPFRALIDSHWCLSSSTLIVACHQSIYAAQAGNGITSIQTKHGEHTAAGARAGYAQGLDRLDMMRRHILYPPGSATRAVSCWSSAPIRRRTNATRRLSLSRLA
jgi:hypothetical protein